MRGPKGGQSQIIAKVSLRKLYARTGELSLVRRSFSVEASHDRTRSGMCTGISSDNSQFTRNLCLCFLARELQYHTRNRHEED
jgi:hypothetical protein